ncbi:MAG: ABC transporter substrate-binding protein [Rhodospirillaceae bacterium]|jgi:NitT/TauT family transport system substrate-binding protein|nr:ABC transporter substrate-binding protein [Rhodospirillaceae bacterium]MBT3931778.1 ABC transporter substrate-binding protein [Rhodospirillaceae bacterium]MBT4774020.1 ABC transporter substrate-binding protein [Rhodospirillaceae bacterium]MBT5358583.1 ABC transporter substrate-binding protein [Rhodospirillaceae bacterium]MBT5768795.1 ABC transporter substrate-binding protein [Rhodospirillaceae bacterium]
MMSFKNLTRRTALTLTAVAALSLTGIAGANAADTVKVGVFPVTSALPYFVALERGYFKDVDIDVEMVRLIGGTALISAMITNDIDVAANLVTIEGMNANLKKPGLVNYISVNSQNKQFKMETFVVRKGFAATKISDLKGAKIMSAPGPANIMMAKAVLAANGLKEGDYQLDQLAMPQHVTAMQAGTYDAGYTLEPAVTLMENQGSASTIETGVIATYILGKDDADAWVAGTALTGKFLADRPAVAKRFAQAWDRALVDIAKDDTVRAHLVKNTFTPEAVAPTVPLVNFVMSDDLSDGDKAEFQQFIDFVTDNGILSEKVDITKYLKTF